MVVPTLQMVALRGGVWLRAGGCRDMCEQRAAISRCHKHGLQVSPFRRGKGLTCIYTDERPDLCRELPNWMFDGSYCGSMTLGLPEISIEGLKELASVLASFSANRNRGAQSNPSIKKEVDRAEKPAAQSSAARPRARTPKSGNTRGGTHKGTGRGSGRSSAGRAVCRNEAGRRG